MVVREGQYALVNVMGVVFKVSDRYVGSYGATVYRMIDGKLVRQFGL